MHEQWMKEALVEARFALAKGEVPVGAVLVLNGKLIGRGHNVSIESSDPTAHAEIRALRDACRKKKNYRIPGSVLYVTLEPCLMCAGAILHSRLAEVVFGAREPIAGAGGTFMNALEAGWLNHHCKVTAGVGAEESTAMLRKFFTNLR